MSSALTGVPASPSLEEPLAQRVLRQARSGQLDEDRLLPGQDKRERDLTKKLDKLAAQAGWYTFVSAQAHAIATGKAPARRNAEIMVVQEITRWRREVETFRDREIGRIRRGHPARAGTSGSPAAPGGRVATSRFEAAGALSRGHSRRRATASGQVFFASLHRFSAFQVAGRCSESLAFSAGRRLVAVRDLLLVVQEHAAQRPPDVHTRGPRSGSEADKA